MSPFKKVWVQIGPCYSLKGKNPKSIKNVVERIAPLKRQHVYPFTTLYLKAEMTKTVDIQVGYSLMTNTFRPRQFNLSYQKG
jgi:hypothetical protein